MPKSNFATDQNGVKYPISEESKFADKFDMDKARQMTKDIADAIADGREVDTTTPEYALYEMLMNRQEEINDQARDRVEAEEQGYSSKLRKETKWQGILRHGSKLTIHMPKSAILIHGRQRIAEKEQVGIPGLFAFGTATTKLYEQSSEDGSVNPWANLALRAIDRRIEEIEEYAAKVQGDCEKMLALRKKMGIEDELATNSQPVSIEMSFGSPYGGGGRDLVAMHDYVSRLIHTCHKASALSSKEKGNLIFTLGRRVRGLFVFAVRISRKLMAEELRQLSAADLAATADESAKIRRAMADEILVGANVAETVDSENLAATCPKFFKHQRKKERAHGATDKERDDGATS